jgi:transcription termination/antitermination protein NusG
MRYYTDNYTGTIHKHLTGFDEAMSTINFESAEKSLDTKAVLVWLAIQTWPRHEKKVATELERKQIEVFLPLVASERQWSDRRQIVQLPLFPTYLFVRAPETFDSRISVLRTNGVIGFVGARNVGTAIPDVEIESIRTLLTRGVAFQNHSYLKVGQRVRIRGGSLDGVEGILEAKNNNLTLIVSIQLLQRSLSIRVAGYRVEPAPSVAMCG